MSSNFRTILGLELRFHTLRPLTWVLLVLLALTSFGLSSGNMTIASGDSTVGGQSKAWLTSEFAVGQLFPLVVFLFYVFFVAIASGMSIPRDDEIKVVPILHSTKLTAGEYVWGKFTAVLATFFAILALHLALQIFFNHFFPHGDAEKIRGPLQVVNYLRPALVFAVPCILFFSGVSLCIGEVTRKPILIFVLPVALFMVSIFFLFSWSPTWLDPRINALLMWLEPSGFRWINETWLKVDRGVEFYNTQPIGYDAPFLLSRLAYAASGVFFVALAARHFARNLRGGRVRAKDAAAAVPPAQSSVSVFGDLARAPLGALGMKVSVPGFVRTVLDVARFEARNLASQPGLYLFTPIILVQTIGSLGFQVGSFDTPLLVTSGGGAVLSMNTLTLLVCVLLMFYTVESVLREWNTGLAQIYYATPSRTAAMLFGKSIANGIVGLVIVVAAMIGVFLVLLAQRDGWNSFLGVYGPAAAVFGLVLAARRVIPAVRSRVRRDDSREKRGFWRSTGQFLLGGLVVTVSAGGLAFLVAAAIQMALGRHDFSFLPFLLVWGLLLLPTFLVWSSFVTAVLALTANRYTTYAMALAALAFTGWRQMNGEMNWVGNWNLWSVLTWSDFGSVDPNAGALLLNRLFWLTIMAFLIALTVRIFPRREHDSGRTIDRMRPVPLLKTALRLAPIAIPAIVLGSALYSRVADGHQGEAAKKRNENYWGRNIATWTEKATPQIGGAYVDVTLDPPARRFQVQGEYALVNWTEKTMRRFPMSVGDHFEDIEWTLGGEAYEPEDHAKLFVFDLDQPLAPNDTVRVGFSHEGSFPRGLNKNGGGMMNFVLPAGVVLTSFNTGFLPLPYFEEGRGTPEDTQIEPKQYEDGFWEGDTPPGIGSGTRFPVRTRITGPADYRYHGVGSLEEETIEDGQRTMVWQSDYPVNFFNVVAGKWDLWEGELVQLWHHPDHTRNVEEIGEAADDAVRWYSEWFHPYPWETLRINEFPGIANYAQGFPTNITFSENIGFLTRSTKESKVAFMVAAHETAHQWWGNILMPGDGPGGNVLSEGMAHYSTILLYQQVHGTEGRIEFCKRIEEKYGDDRQVDAEKPLVWIDGSKAGDTTATYDKGGWVFWMLHDLMGEEACLAGVQAFIRKWSTGIDYPVLHDFVREMRAFAPDVDAYDEFAAQWFHDVVVPEYRLSDFEKSERGSQWIVTAQLENAGTGRMEVEVEAARGERFPDEDEDEEAEPWEAQRTTVWVGAGETVEVSLTCDFEPTSLGVDPDAKILMLERVRANVTL